MDKEILINALIEQGWIAIPKFFEESFCNGLLSEMSSNELKLASIGKGQQQQRNEEIRTDSIVWLEEDHCLPKQKEFFKQMNEIKNWVNQSLFLGIKRYECHYAHYKAGGFYKKHLDQHQYSSARVLSTVTYLSTPSEGGQLVIYNRDNPDEKQATIPAEAGTFVCFLSNQIYHEVLTTEDDRYSLTGWFRTDVQ